MRISATRLIPYRLPFKRAWRTHRGTLRERTGWLLELTTDAGLRGLGDCAPLPEAGTETAARAHCWLTERLPHMPSRSPLEVLDDLPEAPHNPAARHALETALLDLISQHEGLSLRYWISPRAVDEVRVNAACGSLDAGILERCEQRLQQGFKTLKLKVGVIDMVQELDLLHRLTAGLAADINLRLDANRAWSPTQASDFLEAIQDLPIESLEEPLRDPHCPELRQLQDATAISLALDESLPEFSKQQLFEQMPVRRLILKPCVLGGLLPARKLAGQAGQAGMETLITSTLESAVGIQAAAQLAMTIYATKQPLAQGLATSSWFSEDVADPPLITHGLLKLPECPGLGLHSPPTTGEHTCP